MNKPEVQTRVLSALSLGAPLTVACDANGVSVDLIEYWAGEDVTFAEAKARAFRLGFDRLAHECLEIADDARNDWMERQDADGKSLGWQYNGEAVQRSRLRIDTRRWLLGVWDRAGYGPQQQVSVKAQVDVTETKRHVIDPRALDDAGRAALRHVLAQAQAAGLIAPPDDAVETDYAIVSDRMTGDRHNDDTSD